MTSIRRRTTPTTPSLDATGPLGPAGPIGPAAPCGPAAPASPFGPCGPASQWAGPTGPTPVLWGRPLQRHPSVRIWSNRSDVALGALRPGVTLGTGCPGPCRATRADSGPVAPTGPAGPVGPASPLAPDGPASPLGPAGPAGPATSCTFETRRLHVRGNGRHRRRWRTRPPVMALRISSTTKKMAAPRDARPHASRPKIAVHRPVSL